ncbi:hypothetical protein LguiA_002801 [Lonicera macranthoides]
MPPRKKPPTASERLRKTKQYIRKKKGKSASSHDPTLEASPSHGSTSKGTPTQGVTPMASPYTPGSSSRAASQEDDGGPVDKSVLITFNDHVAYAIWHRTLEEGNYKKLHTMCHWLKLKSWDLSNEVEGVQQRVRNSALRERPDDLIEFDGANSLGYNMFAKKQAGIVATLALLEGVMFGGQTHDSSDTVNEAYDILKAASVDNEEEDRMPESRTNSRLESRTKSRHDPVATAPAPAATIPTLTRSKPPSKKRPKK